MQVSAGNLKERVEIDIPRFAARRKLAIAQAKGSSAEVARAYGVTQRWVRKVRNGETSDDRQTWLFEEP